MGPTYECALARIIDKESDLEVREKYCISRNALAQTEFTEKDFGDSTLTITRLEDSSRILQVSVAAFMAAALLSF